MNNISYSPLESARFNMRILRGTASELAPEALLRTIADEQVDVAILRIPTNKPHRLAQLSAMLPYPMVLADTVLTFKCDMRASPPQPLRNPRLVVRRATTGDEPAVLELVEVIFNNYHTHYNTNPLFSPQSVLAGYQEWALSFLHSTTPEKACFLFYLDNRPIALTTIALHEKYGDGMLMGARPDATSPGLGGDLVRQIKHYSLSHGRRWVHGTTQVQNHGVQRMLIQEGFSPAESHYTIHINSLLSQKTQPLVAGLQ
ncbi:GNAT family N-acetyltransferase [Hymenobacter negativus]|uniref:N-acetyltransferase domain-containing protein n=1 Tax=Hymenobacter negativus TaxID=2795026 RepID=A0ABS0Q4C4_9BACT|nr:hypothetical protein [Hymenobacter negativus]MBH8557417.1 hypothetical protein [Hymenobacter negativus]